MVVVVVVLVEGGCGKKCEGGDNSSNTWVKHEDSY